MIGSSLHLSLRTRLDILTPVLTLARFEKNPLAISRQALKYIFRYLKGSIFNGLNYFSNEISLNCFFVSNFAGECIIERQWLATLQNLEKLYALEELTSRKRSYFPRAKLSIMPWPDLQRKWYGWLGFWMNQVEVLAIRWVLNQMVTGQLSGQQLKKQYHPEQDSKMRKYILWKS